MVWFRIRFFNKLLSILHAIEYVLVVYSTIINRCCKQVLYLTSISTDTFTSHTSLTPPRARSLRLPSSYIHPSWYGCSARDWWSWGRVSMLRACVVRVFLRDAAPPSMMNQILDCTYIIVYIYVAVPVNSYSYSFHPPLSFTLIVTLWHTIFLSYPGHLPWNVSMQTCLTCCEPYIPTYHF